MKITPKRLIQHWRAKAVCVLLATGLWYIIKQNLREEMPRWPEPAAAAQSLSR